MTGGRGSWRWQGSHMCVFPKQNLTPEPKVIGGERAEHEKCIENVAALLKIVNALAWC